MENSKKTISKNIKKDFLKQEVCTTGCIVLITLIGALFLNNLPVGLGLGTIAGMCIDEYTDNKYV